MGNVLARIKAKGKNFEIIVDCDKALAFRKGQLGNVNNVLISADIFSEAKKSIKVKESELKDAFGTINPEEIASKIIKEGEIQLPSEYKAKERENRMKQVIDFIATNCADPKGMPHPPARIEAALKQANVKIEDNRSVDEQIHAILKKIQPILPLSMETKKMSIQVSAEYTGQVYGLLKDYITSEEWLSDGSLSCAVALPTGVRMIFFDKLNRLTHGTALTQEIKEQK